jgi:hypothetical protein
MAQSYTDENLPNEPIRLKAAPGYTHHRNYRGFSWPRNISVTYSFSIQ